MMRRIWMQLVWLFGTGPNQTAREMLPRALRLGDGTACREYEEAA